MDKISSILPANSRVTTVDMRNTGVSRPGSPSFGRTMGISTPDQKKMELETSVKANTEFKNQMNIRNNDDVKKSQIVQRMADDFFNKRVETKDEDVDLGLDPSTDMKVDVRPMKIEKELNTVDFRDMLNDVKAAKSDSKKEKVAVQSQETKSDEPEFDEEALATGQYLDVRA